MVNFPASEHHSPLAGTKLYCLVIEAHVSEQLAQDRYMKMEWPGVEPVTSWSQVHCFNHDITTIQLNNFNSVYSAGY